MEWLHNPHARFWYTEQNYYVTDRDWQPGDNWSGGLIRGLYRKDWSGYVASKEEAIEWCERHYSVHKE